MFGFRRDCKIEIIVKKMIDRYYDLILINKIENILIMRCLLADLLL